MSDTHRIIFRFSPRYMMTSTAKITILVLIVLALGAGVYYWTSSQNTQTESIPEGTVLEADANLGATTTLPTGGSTSDASLDTDLSSIDAQLNAFSSDSAAVGTSLNDQAVTQSSI